MNNYHTLKNFEEFIDDIIIARGEKYFESGAVNDLEEIEDGQWSALVEGTEVYEVMVTLDGDKIIESSCDCPYDLGPVCKHEVAMYFAMRERNEGENSRTKKDKKIKKKSASKETTKKTELNKKKTAAQKIDEIIEKLGFEGLSSLVREYAMEDRDFRDLLLIKVVHLDDEADREDYRDIIRAPINAAAHHGFIDYRSMGSAFRGVDEVLRRAEDFLEKKQASEVIPICQALIEEMVNVVEMCDDSGGGEVGTAIELAFEMLRESAGMLNEKESGELFRYCLREACHRRYDGWEDWRWDLVRIAAGLALTGNWEKKLFDTIDLIMKLERNSEWGREYAEEQAAKIKMYYFKKIKDEKRLADFIRSHILIKSIREEALSRALKDRDYIKAKGLAREGIEIADKKNHGGTVNEWKKRLLDIAVKENNRDDERAYARELFIDTRDFEFYDKFKKTFSEKEWSAALALLIEELHKNGKSSWSYSSLLPGIFIREKKWQDLLKYVSSHVTFESLEVHHNRLAPLFPEEIYNLYERAVRDILEKNTGRSHYQRASRALRRMKKLDQNKHIDIFIEELKQTYKNRPALLDEIKKI